MNTKTLPSRSSLRFMVLIMDDEDNTYEPFINTNDMSIVVGRVISGIDVLQQRVKFTN